VGDPNWKPVDLQRPEDVAPTATARMLRVPPELAGMRLDVFLKVSLRSTSRTRAKRIAQQAAFDVDGRRMRPNQRLKPEEQIILWRVPIDEIDDQFALPVLYRDEHLLVINKPADITVHPTASHYHHTVIKLLEHREPGQYFSLIHRLDRDTSGVLLLALTPRADRAFKMLLEGTIEIPEGAPSELIKTYEAITWGVPDEGRIELPLERDPDNPLRVKMRVAAPGTGLNAATEVTVVERRAQYARVRCRLLTGRQHQIRIHLAATGTPVVGDKLYGPDERLHARAADGLLTPEDLLRLELPRHALHAWRYQLPHAIEWRPMDLMAPFPEDLARFWSQISR